MPQPITAPEDLLRADLDHLIHPLYHPQFHSEALIFTRGRGIYLYDAQGREYIDGLSCLWNVNAGHGREELAKAAYDQMCELAYASNYTGSTVIPAIRLAEKLTQIAYPSLQHVYFTCGGAESNESAFKTARFYWKMKGRPEKVNIISRLGGYHGLTTGAMSATGMPEYHVNFAPMAPGFHHVEPPYRVRTARGVLEQDGIAPLEARIQELGPETVAGIICEPVMGAGGVVPPPDDFFPRLRNLCNRYEILLMADEVITGFGRTGSWFALTHWGVEPDMLSFAKGVTSAQLPLGGIMISDEIYRTITSDPGKRWMHAYTYSGHATCCAVGLKNLEIMERERLIENARVMGERLQRGFDSLLDLPQVHNVRGIGLMAGVQLLDPDGTARPITDASGPMGQRLFQEALRRGLFTRFRGNTLVVAPPLIITAEEVDRLVEIVRDSIIAATRP